MIFLAIIMQFGWKLSVFALSSLDITQVMAVVFGVILVSGSGQTDQLKWVIGLLLSLTVAMCTLNCSSLPCTVSLCEQAGMFAYSMALLVSERNERAHRFTQRKEYVWITWLFISLFNIFSFFFFFLFFVKDKQVVRMKEENLLQRRLSLCPSATSPPKIDPRSLTRNLSYGGDNDIYNFSPGMNLQSWHFCTLKWLNETEYGDISGTCVGGFLCQWKYAVLCCRVIIP